MPFVLERLHRNFGIAAELIDFPLGIREALLVPLKPRDSRLPLSKALPKAGDFRLQLCLGLPQRLGRLRFIQRVQNPFEQHILVQNRSIRSLQLLPGLLRQEKDVSQRVQLKLVDAAVEAALKELVQIVVHCLELVMPLVKLLQGFPIVILLL
eukprot:scaffold7067_cov245-Pinguiococcus_pyrenoidosus.AAC.11